MLGIAISHPHVVTASFHACHILHKCGSYFTDEKERKQVIKFIDKFEETAGWNTAHLRQRLHELWGRTTT